MISWLGLSWSKYTAAEREDPALPSVSSCEVPLPPISSATHRTVARSVGWSSWKPTFFPGWVVGSCSRESNWPVWGPPDLNNMTSRPCFFFILKSILAWSLPASWMPLLFLCIVSMLFMFLGRRGKCFPSYILPLSHILQNLNILLEISTSLASPSGQLRSFRLEPAHTQPWTLPKLQTDKVKYILLTALPFHKPCLLASVVWTISLLTW